MALVFAAAGVSRAHLTALGSRLNVTGSISARTGCAPARRIALTEAKKLKGVVRTASPGANLGSDAGPARGRPYPKSNQLRGLRRAGRRRRARMTQPARPRMNCCVSSTCSRAAEEFLLKRLILPFQVEHRDGDCRLVLGGCGIRVVWHRSWYQQFRGAIPRRACRIVTRGTGH